MRWECKGLIKQTPQLTKVTAQGHRGSWHGKKPCGRCQCKCQWPILRRCHLGPLRIQQYWYHAHHSGNTRESSEELGNSTGTLDGFWGDIILRLRWALPAIFSRASKPWRRAMTSRYGMVPSSNLQQVSEALKSELTLYWQTWVPVNHGFTQCWWNTVGKLETQIIYATGCRTSHETIIR